MSLGKLKFVELLPLTYVELFSIKRENLDLPWDEKLIGRYKKPIPLGWALSEWDVVDRDKAYDFFREEGFYVLNPNECEDKIFWVERM